MNALIPTQSTLKNAAWTIAILAAALRVRMVRDLVLGR